MSVSDTDLVSVAGCLVVALCSAMAPVQERPSSPGSAVYERACASCHDGEDPRAPTRRALARLSPRAIVDSLTVGSMRYQGLALSGEERRVVAEYLTERTLRGTVAGATSGRCTRTPPMGDPAAGARWNGWSPDATNAHFQPANRAGLTADQVPKLQLKWAFGFSDAASAWSQPTVAGGRLFVGSQNGIVYSLSASTGCVVWTFAAHAGVRASISIGAIGPRTSRKYAAYVADQQGYVYALDAATGDTLWTRRVDDHPLVRLTGSPALHGGRLYVPTSSYEEGGKTPPYKCCTFRGSIVALDAVSGDVIWKSHTIRDAPTLQRAYADGTEDWGPSGGGIWSAPTIDVKRRALYVGVGNAYSGPVTGTTDAIVAFDLNSGQMRWAHQTTPNDVFGCVAGEINCAERPGPDFDFGASPALVKTSRGRDLIVAGQKSGVAYALDPDRQGAQVWRYRAGGGSGLGGIQWGLAADDARAYLPVAEIYAAEPGGLHAVDLVTGRRAWLAPPLPPVCGKPSRACSSAQFSAVTVIPGVVLSPSNDGAVRAYSTADGSVIWTFDTNRDFRTVNAVPARGGSMNGPAPVVAGGIVYVSSGYGAFGLRPGNVLLAFAAE